MRFAFVRVHQVADNNRNRWTPKFTVNKATAPLGRHWARFGSNIRGWDLVWTNIPLSHFIADPADYHLLEDVIRLNMRINEIPNAKRQAMDAWLVNHGYDTGWITPTTTLKEVLKDILHWLNDRQGIPDKFIRFCTQFMVD